MKWKSVAAALVLVVLALLAWNAGTSDDPVATATDRTADSLPTDDDAIAERDARRRVAQEAGGATAELESEESVEVDANTARDLFAELQHRHGSNEPSGHCKVAINDEMADWDDSVSDGDTVLLFPPVAGG